MPFLRVSIHLNATDHLLSSKRELHTAALPSGRRGNHAAMTAPPKRKGVLCREGPANTRVAR